MVDWTKIGNNIRSLRLAYGETQEQLGFVIGDKGKNVISYYENGGRHPKEKTLELIAKHYLVSVAELKTCDFTNIKKISVDINAYYRNIRIIFPIVFSEKAMKNDLFKVAYKSHCAFFSELYKLSPSEVVSRSEICIDNYTEALSNDESLVEAAANLLGLFYFLLGEMTMNQMLINNKPAALMQIASNNRKVRKLIDDADILTESGSYNDEIVDDEINAFLSELLYVVKHSEVLSDLADYYLALQYILNMVDNELEYEDNRRIGAEMMVTFLRVKNPYVKRYLKFGLESIEIRSSHNVDDKK